MGAIELPDAEPSGERDAGDRREQRQQRARGAARRLELQGLWVGLHGNTRGGHEAARPR
jgi:hypothetical protein